MIACQKCRTTENSSDKAESEDPAFQQSLQVLTSLDDNIHLVEQRVCTIRENTMLWNTIEKMMEELSAWLNVKKEQLKQLRRKSAKLHVETAEMDIRRIQVSLIIIYALCNIL